MKKTISFYKLTAAGNDFVLIDNRQNVVAEKEHSKLAAKLSGYPFRITQKTKLKEATDYISDFMYDEAAALIREILPAIE